MRQIFTAKKLEDAKRQAVQAFGVSESQIVFRILEQKKGLMGIGASVTIEAIYEPPVAAVETPAPAAEPMPEPQAAAPVVEETVETITETVVEPETDAVVEETVSVTETVTVTEPAAGAESEAVATESAEPLSLDSLTPEQQAAVKRVQDYVAPFMKSWALLLPQPQRYRKTVFCWKSAAIAEAVRLLADGAKPSMRCSISLPSSPTRVKKITAGLFWIAMAIGKSVARPLNTLQNGLQRR